MGLDSKKFVKKRRVPRRKYDQKVAVLFKGTYEIFRAHELGERGMLISGPFTLRENDRLVITFHVPGLLHTVTRAVVRYGITDERSKITRYGCEFDDLDFTARRLIRIYVANKPADEDKQMAKFQIAQLGRSDSPSS